MRSGRQSEKLPISPAALALLVLLLLTPLHPADAASGDAEPPKTTVDWVLAEEKPERNEVIEAWLIVEGEWPVPAGPPSGNAQLEVSGPAGVEVWLATSSASCPPAVPPSGAAPAALRRTTPLSGPGLVKVCVEPRQRRPFRLLAELTLPDGEVERAASDLVEVEPGWRPGAASVAALSALVGFLLGLFGKYLERWIEKLLVRRKAQIELVNFVAQSVAREWIENRDALLAFLKDEQQDPPTLRTVKYNELLGDEGAMGFLREAERRRYLARVRTVYRKIGAFNTSVMRFKQAKIARDEIQEESRKMAALLSSRAGAHEHREEDNP